MGRIKPKKPRRPRLGRVVCAECGVERPWFSMARIDVDAAGRPTLHGPICTACAAKVRGGDSA